MPRIKGYRWLPDGALLAFNSAEPYHQNFLARHPDSPYIVFYDLPKLRALQAKFPGAYE